MYDPHIQRDIDVIQPFFREVFPRVLKASGLPKEELHARVDAWRMEASNKQHERLMALAAQGDDVTRETNGTVRITSRTVERLKTIDRVGITTGPGTRCIVAMVEHHDEIGITATVMRQILNESAAALGTTVRDLLPELVPFIKGQMPQTVSARSH